MQEDRLHERHRPNPSGEHAVIVGPDNGDDVGNAVELEVGFRILAEKQIERGSKQNATPHQRAGGPKRFRVNPGSLEAL